MRKAAVIVILVIVLVYRQMGPVPAIAASSTYQCAAGEVDQVLSNPATGKRLIARNGGERVEVWTEHGNQPVKQMSVAGHLQPVYTVAVGPGGKTVITGGSGNGGAGGTAILWDVQSGAIVHRLSFPEWVVNTAYAPDGKTLLAGDYDGVTTIWDAQSGETLHMLQGPGKAGVTGIAYAPDSKTVLISDDDDFSATLWDVQSGKLLQTLRGHMGIVTSLAYAPDGKTFLTGSADHTAILWDMQSGAILHTLRGQTKAVTSVAYALDGKVVLTAARMVLCFYGMSSRAPRSAPWVPYLERQSRIGGTWCLNT